MYYNDHYTLESNFVQNIFLSIIAQSCTHRSAKCFDHEGLHQLLFINCSE